MVSILHIQSSIYLVFFPDNTVEANPGHIARATIVCRLTAPVPLLPILLGYPILLSLS